LIAVVENEHIYIFAYEKNMLMLAVRGLVVGALWILLGKRFWLFPNILAEEATLKELFQFWPQKDEGERPKWPARLFYAIAGVVLISLLRHHAPDEAARARFAVLHLYSNAFMKFGFSGRKRDPVI